METQQRRVTMDKTPSAKKLHQWLLPLLIVAIIFAIIYSALRDNFHVVIKDRVYRSAQLSESALKVLVHLRGIQSVINLRGPNPGKNWYDEEVKMTAALNIQHYDLRLESDKLPAPIELRELVDIIQRAPKPILIHCLNGSDRVGLASAIAMIVLENAPLKEAKKQLSWRYFIISDKSIGRQVFSHYQEWLNQNHESSNTTNFIKWAYSVHPFNNTPKQ